MLRKLAIAIAASGAMSAAQVYALGLGEIELDSALNQPLDARIKLVKASELENWEIKPSLASADEFEGAGVERVFFLNNMKFEVEREGGDVYVNLSTQQPVVEPFLNFLVQVDWPNGRLLREYTLLLDPPVFNEDVPAEPVSAPEQDMQPEEDMPLPGTGVAQSQPATQTVPVPVPAPIEEEPAYEPAAEPESQAMDEERTYAVRPNDTLWEIALDVRPATDISPQQIMLAIQDENPDAFIRGNINRLKKNQILRIPEESDMRSRSFRESVAQVAAQNEVLAQRRAQLDATRKSEVIDRDDSLSDAQLTLLADGGATAEGERQASGQVDDRAAGDQSKLEQELSLALENLDKSNRENQELMTRLEALEEQINMLQRLINLKDEQMVALQTGMSDSAAAETADQPAPASDMVAGEAEQAAVDTTSPAPAEKDLNFANESEITDSETTDSENAADVAVTPAQPAEQPKTPIAPRNLPPVPQPKGPMDFVMENLPLVGGGLLAILLGLLGVRALQNRKENNNTDSEKENAFLAETMDDLADHPMDGSADTLDDEFADLELGDEVVDGGVSDIEGSALDMSAASDAGLPDALDEHHESSDVLGEADMYMAYGRLDRAKDLLETTLATEPGRVDLRSKLLEVLSEQDDAVAFAEHFETVMADGNDEQKDLANRLRQKLSNPEAGAENELVLDSDLSGGEELDFSEFETDDLGLPEDTSELDLNDDGNELDFDLDGLEMDAGDAVETLAEAGSESTADDDNALEFELNLDSDDGLASDLDETPLDLGIDDALEDADGDMSLDFELDDAENDFSLDTVDADLPTLDGDDSNDLSSLDELSLDDDLSSGSNDELPTLDLDDEASLELDSDLAELDSDLDLDQEMDLTLDGSADELSDLDALESELDSELADLDGDMELELDTSDLDADALNDGLSEEVSLAELEAELDDDLSLDADASELELPELTADDELTAPELAAEELDGVDLDLASDSDASLDVPELAPELDADADLADVPELASEPEPLKEAVAEADAPQPAAEEGGDLNLDDLDDDLDFLSGTDESETKLDLARAYIDMDDKDGAREILGEVIEEGNDEQKQEASKLMDSLS